MNEEPIVFNGKNLTLDDLYSITKKSHEIKLASSAKNRIKTSAQIVQEILKGKKKVYGITEIITLWTTKEAYKERLKLYKEYENSKYYKKLQHRMLYGI